MTRKPLLLALLVGALLLVLSAAPAIADPGDANSGTLADPGNQAHHVKGISPTADNFTQCWAVLNANGTLARGGTDDFGNPCVTSSRKVPGFTGAYEVIFNDFVWDCAYTATIGNPGSGQAAPGTIDVAQRFSSVNGVFVQTHTTTGAVSDRPFYLKVTC